MIIDANMNPAPTSCCHDISSVNRTAPTTKLVIGSNALSIVTVVGFNTFSPTWRRTPPTELQTTARSSTLTTPCHVKAKLILAVKILANRKMTVRITA